MENNPYIANIDELKRIHGFIESRIQTLQAMKLQYEAQPHLQKILNAVETIIGYCAKRHDIASLKYIQYQLEDLAEDVRHEVNVIENEETKRGEHKS